MTSQPSPKHPLIKRRTGPSIAFAIVTAVAATVGVGGPVAGIAKADGKPKATYQLSGSSPVADYISYETDTGQQDQANVKLPWTTQFSTFGGEVFVVSAEAPGSITCTILLDGKMVSQATAHGQPARTVCSH